MPTDLPIEVAALVDRLLRGVRAALGDDLVGFYLRGSLALGDFNPETSDVDVLVVTARPPTEDQYAALDALHAAVPAHQNEYGRHYEVSYVDRDAVRRFGAHERVHPTVGSDWAFHKSIHRDNFVLERWTVREHGIALVGPDAKELIDPIDPAGLRAAVRNELRDRITSWAGGGEPPEWLAARYYQAFEIETICRALFTLEFGDLPTKPRAVTWALGYLPEPWRSLVKWSQAHRADRTLDGSRIHEIQSFVCWAAEQMITTEEDTSG
jgi:hypothetical protein